jgi:hypothetical protein
MSLKDYDPGFPWYAAVGRLHRPDEFVRINRGCAAAVRRAVKKHGDDATVFYRPTGSWTRGKRWLADRAHAKKLWKGIREEPTP